MVLLCALWCLDMCRLCKLGTVHSGLGKHVRVSVPFAHALHDTTLDLQRPCGKNNCVYV